MINGNLKATYAADEQVLNNAYKRAFVYGMALLCAALPFVANDYIILVAAQMGIILIAVVGVNVVIGYTGLLSLGHAAFIAIGAYSIPILHTLFASLGVPEGIMPFLAIPLAVAISALVGIVVGLPSLRVKGLYLAVATLSANFIVIFLIELDAMAPYMIGSYGNPHSKTHAFGWEAEAAVEIARAQVAARDAKAAAETVAADSAASPSSTCSQSGASFSTLLLEVVVRQPKVDNHLSGNSQCVAKDLYTQSINGASG